MPFKDLVLLLLAFIIGSNIRIQKQGLMNFPLIYSYIVVLLPASQLTTFYKSVKSQEAFWNGTNIEALYLLENLELISIS